MNALRRGLAVGERGCSGAPAAESLHLPSCALRLGRSPPRAQRCPLEPAAAGSSSNSMLAAVSRAQWRVAAAGGARGRRVRAATLFSLLQPVAGGRWPAGGRLHGFPWTLAVPGTARTPTPGGAPRGQHTASKRRARSLARSSNPAVGLRSQSYSLLYGGYEAAASARRTFSMTFGLSGSITPVYWSSRQLPNCALIPARPNRDGTRPLQRAAHVRSNARTRAARCAVSLAAAPGLRLVLWVTCDRTHLL